MELRGTNSATLADLLPRAAERYGSAPAILFKAEGAWVSRSFEEVRDTVRDLALGLADLGVAKGDKVAILAHTRPLWTYFDFALLSLGAVVVPIYQTNSPEECRYVLEDSDSKLVIVEDEEQLEKIRKVRDRLPLLEQVILMTGSGEGAISFEDLAARTSGGEQAEWEKHYTAVRPEDVCSLIYTSGTTGPPKGCIITHANYRAMVEMANEVGLLAEDGVVYLYLPLAHSFALLVQFDTFDVGRTLAYWERDPQKIIPNLAELKPTYFPSVPRIFEKIYSKATSAIEQEGSLKKAVFNWAIRTGERMREVERSGREAGLLLRKQYAFADKKVLSKIRALFGGRLHLAISGAAPINPDILRFFNAAGVLVLEGWGMTETSTAATVSTPDDFKIGTIGKPFSRCEVKIAEDGEILVKGPNVFQGYYKNEEATRGTIVDGWLYTGDLGSVDEDGYIAITGRKKDIIVTAGGKNISPANLENEVRKHPLVSQCVVVGDRRPYLVALVTLDPEEAVAFAKEHGLAEDPEQLAASPAIREAVQAHLDEVNEKVARAEQIKKFAILPRDFTQAAGELTPTLKVKRNVVAERYAREIEELYSD